MNKESKIECSNCKGGCMYPAGNDWRNSKCPCFCHQPKEEHKIGKHGAVSLVGQDKDTCVECGKEVTPKESREDWEKELREELDLKYDLLGIKKQPLGVRENWIESDIKTVKFLLTKTKLQTLNEVLEVLDQSNWGNFNKGCDCNMCFANKKTLDSIKQKIKQL